MSKLAATMELSQALRYFKPIWEFHAQNLKRYFHASVFLFNTVWMIYGLLLTTFNYDVNHPCEFLHHGFRYFPFFLSLWVTAAQYTYFGMYFIIDFMEVYSKDAKLTAKYTSIIHQVASYLLFTLVFPLSWVILVFFWGFYLWDRNVIYPEILDTYIPPWLNHAMHTVPVPLTVIYMATSNRVEPPKQASLAGLVAFVSAYLAIFIMVKVRDGKWIYLVFDAVTPAQTKIIFFVIILGAIMFHIIGYKINETLNYFKRNLKLTLA